MTNDMMDLRSLVEKSADADLLREMIGFAAEKLMELEVGTKTGAPTARRMTFDLLSVTDIAIATGRPELELLNFEFQSYALAATSRAFWSRVAWLRRL